MKKRWKMLVAALGVTALVVSQNGVLQVNAEEAIDGEDSVAVAETDSKEEVNEGEDGSTNSSALLAPTNLEWNNIGQGIFVNPNEAASLVAILYYNEADTGLTYCDGNVYSRDQKATYDLYHLIESYGQNGVYKFKGQAVYNWGRDRSELSDYSGEFTYTRPSEQLPNPIVTVSESGVVTCELPSGNNYTLGSDYGFYYGIKIDGRQIDSPFGLDSTQINLSDYVTLEEGHSYTVGVQTLSRNINKYLSSDNWSACTLDLRSNDSSAAVVNKSELTTSVLEVKEWKPTTPDEKKRYAVYGKEKVVYTADNGNAYSVTIQNAMQGKKCFDSFEAVLMDWKIGRTYNIFPSGKIAYKMNEKTRVTLSIPQALQAAGREFKMICVTQNGQPIILDDLDSDPNTITFETDTYYAFALVYKDIAVSK